MKSVDELSQEVKLRELTPEEVKYVLQKVKELTISHDKDLPKWIHLLGFETACINLYISDTI